MSKLDYDFKFPAADRDTRGQAKQIAEWSKTQVPIATQRVEDFLQRHDVWYLLNRNEEAFGCPQAASVRRCLGQTGIPLGRELKTFLGQFTDETGAINQVAVHCRAIHELDMNKIKAALQIPGDVSRLEVSKEVDTSDNEEMLGVYGLVNPFTLEIASIEGNITIQLFDENLFESFELPPTLMTNAGDRTWSVEFQIEEIEKLIPPRRLLRADVVKEAPVFYRPVIGILTGNSPESGALLWDRITKRVRELRDPRNQVPELRSKFSISLTGDVYMPKVLVRSVPAMGMTMELHLRSEQTWNLIRVEIERICSELSSADHVGKNVLAIACNTTPYYSDRIVAIADHFNVRFVSIVDAVDEYLDEHSISSIVLLGIGYIHRPEFSGYSRLFSRQGFNIHPLKEATLSEIEELAHDVKCGRPIHECSQKLSAILKRYDLSGRNVVIALTELSLIVVGAKWKKESGDQSHTNNVTHLIDAVDVYAKLLADLFLGYRDISSLKYPPIV